MMKNIVKCICELSEKQMLSSVAFQESNGNVLQCLHFKLPPFKMISARQKWLLFPGIIKVYFAF